MYGYYARGQQMLENVLRDAPRVPALEQILDRKWEPLLGGMVETLVPGWRSAEEKKEKPAPDSDDVELRASLRVALDFFTWKTLTASGLSTEKAAQLATAWIATASRFPL